VKKLGKLNSEIQKIKIKPILKLKKNIVKLSEYQLPLKISLKKGI